MGSYPELLCLTQLPVLVFARARAATASCAVFLDCINQCKSCSFRLLIRLVQSGPIGKRISSSEGTNLVLCGNTSCGERILISIQRSEDAPNGYQHHFLEMFYFRRKPSQLIHPLGHYSLDINSLHQDLVTSPETDLTKTSKLVKTTL